MNACLESVYSNMRNDVINFSRAAVDTHVQVYVCMLSLMAVFNAGAGTV